VRTAADAWRRRAQVIVFAPDANPPAEYRGAKARSAALFLPAAARKPPRHMRRSRACSCASADACDPAPPPPRHQVYGLAGVPLPFYNSTTLRLSLGLSPRVWSTVRSLARACLACLRPRCARR